MTYFVGAALTWAGAIAEPTATVLISTAAKALTKVRLRLVRPDIFILPFPPPFDLGGHGTVYSRTVPNAENWEKWMVRPIIVIEVGRNRHPTLAQFANPVRNHWAGPELFQSDKIRKGVTMFGKLAGAWLGSRIIGRNSGAKGALLGAGVAALARRGLGPLAAGAAVIYGAKKLLDRRRSRSSPSYPSDSTPSS